MVTVTIDNQPVAVPEGATILQAARKLGLDIPSLCYLEGYQAATSCMVCLVRLPDANRIVPSCATRAEDGMRVESETDEVRRLRKTGIELILSDHLGDCFAPCQNTCPCHMDIPLMLRQVEAREPADAIVTIKKDIALPAILGRVCPEVCERGCRRKDIDSPTAICRIKRHVADVDLASPTPYLPPCRPDSGKKVVIIGAGPTGLSAAFHLREVGHACTIFDERSEPGGMLRRDFDEAELPRNVLDGEIGIIERMGAKFEMNTSVGKDVTLAALRDRFDGVLITAGALPDDTDTWLDLPAPRGRLRCDPRTHETSLPGVFAAGDVVRPNKLVVQSVADGKLVAQCIDQYLTADQVTGSPRGFSVRAGRMCGEELVSLSIGSSGIQRVTPAGGPSAGLTAEEARAEAERCLGCDCGRQVGCRLKHYAEQYGANPNRFGGDKRTFERQVQPGGVIYEPGKCIACGLCVQIAAEAGEPLGLTFVGRGFDLRVGVPFDRSIAEGLARAARQCAEACPTGAIVLSTGLTGACGACGGSPAPPAGGGA